MKALGIRKCNIAEQLGYNMKTTFWQDFCIADGCGLYDTDKAIDAIKDTYKRAFDEWKDNVEYLTELVMVLNWKIWEWVSLENENIGRAYDKLWREADGWACDNLKGDDLSYFLKTTD